MAITPAITTYAGGADLSRTTPHPHTVIRRQRITFPEAEAEEDGFRQHAGINGPGASARWTARDFAGFNAAAFALLNAADFEIPLILSTDDDITDIADALEAGDDAAAFTLALRDMPVEGHA